MAMGTLPVAALADTAVETQATKDYESAATGDDLTFTYNGKDYTQSNGKTVTIAEADYNENDVSVVLKTLGDYTFETTEDESIFLLKDGDKTAAVATASFNTGTDTLTVSYSLVDSDDHVVNPGKTDFKTNIILDIRTQTLSGLSVNRVDEKGNQVTSLGSLTYNGAKQYVGIFEDGIKVDDVTITGVASQPATGAAGQDADGWFVTRAGNYTFNIQKTDASGNVIDTGKISVNVAKLNLSLLPASSPVTSSPRLTLMTS